MEKSLDSTTSDEGWRLTHMGRLLGHALRRFDERVLELMAHALDVPLALSNLAARGQVGAAHVHITRHLPLAGARLTELAQSAGMGITLHLPSLQMKHLKLRLIRKGSLSN